MEFDHFMHDATGFVFWMPIGYGIIIVYLILIVFMLLFGAKKRTAVWNLFYAIFLTGLFYAFMKYKYSNFINTVTGEMDLSMDNFVPPRMPSGMMVRPPPRR